MLLEPRPGELRILCHVLLYMLMSVCYNSLGVAQHRWDDLKNMCELV